MRIMVLVSQTWNVIWFDGYPDETVSGRSYRQGVLGGDPEWYRRYRRINRIFYRQKDHCYESHLEDYIFATNLLKQAGYLITKGRAS